MSNTPVDRYACDIVFSNVFSRKSLIIPTISNVRWTSARRKTRQPTRVASLYFSMSVMNPAPRLWRPLIQMPPSISMSVREGMWAKSERHLRVGWKQNSRLSSGP
jgi:hypothetical protein